jgi:hypothetical protein
VTYSIAVSEFSVAPSVGIGAVDRFMRQSTPFSHTVVSFLREDGSMIAEINGLATDKYGNVRAMGLAIRGDKILGYINEALLHKSTA